MARYTPTSCSFPVTEGILIKSLCNANSSADFSLPKGKFMPNGSLKGISKACVAAAWRERSAGNASFMVQKLRESRCVTRVRVCETSIDGEEEELMTVQVGDGAGTK